MNWLFNVTINDISVMYVTAHRYAGGLKKKLTLDLRSGSQRHRHFVGFFNVPVQVYNKVTSGNKAMYTVLVNCPIGANVLLVSTNRTYPSPKNARTRCPKEQVSSVRMSHLSQIFYGKPFGIW